MQNMILSFLLTVYLIHACLASNDHVEQRHAPVKLPSFSNLLSKNLKHPIDHYDSYNLNNSYDSESRFLNPLSLFYSPLNPLLYILNSAACVSSSGLSGVCTSSVQCTLSGGSGSGSCGFGNVCCINTITSCGSSTTRNNTYWQSPTTINANQPCALTVHLDSNSLDQRRAPICQVRLDFQSFSIAQPDQTSSVCNAENFQVSGAFIGNSVICGDNNGQHMYLTAQSSNSDITLTFNFDSTQTITRSWNIKIGLLPCGASYLAPTNCLQYFYGSSSGTIQSYNFKNVGPGTAIRQLGNQNYLICVRQEKGFCGICYTQCRSTTTPPTFPFSISFNAGPPVANVPITPNAGVSTGPCRGDYMIIADGYDIQYPPYLSDRYCGTALDAQQLGKGSTVCTSLKPFNIWYVTDSTEDPTAPYPEIGNLGFCLTYKEQTC